MDGEHDGVLSRFAELEEAANANQAALLASLEAEEQCAIAAKAKRSHRGKRKKKACKGLQSGPSQPGVEKSAEQPFQDTSEPPTPETPTPEVEKGVKGMEDVDAASARLQGSSEVTRQQAVMSNGRSECMGAARAGNTVFQLQSSSCPSCRIRLC